MLTYATETDCNISRSVCWHATETDHTSFRSVCWHMPQKQTIIAPELCLISATETDHIIVRSVCWRMSQKQTVRFPEVHEDICHRHRPKQFQKCMLTYHKIRPTSFSSVCWHTPQKQSIRAPEILCGTKLPMLLPLHINLSLEHHIIYKLVWYLLYLTHNTSAVSYQKVNCLINTCVNSHRHNILNSSLMCCALNPDGF
jgi:hypothetical protein